MDQQINVSLSNQYIKKKFFLNQYPALAGVAQWTERWPVNQRVTGLIPGWGTCQPGRVPSEGRAKGNHTLMFLSVSFPFLPLCLEQK